MQKSTDSKRLYSETSMSGITPQKKQKPSIKQLNTLDIHWQDDEREQSTIVEHQNGVTTTQLYKTTKTPPITPPNIHKFLYENERIVTSGINGKRRNTTITTKHPNFEDQNSDTEDDSVENATNDVKEIEIYNIETNTTVSQSLEVIAQIRTYKTNEVVLQNPDILYNNAYKYQFVLDCSDEIVHTGYVTPRLLNLKKNQIIRGNIGVKSANPVFEFVLLYKLHNISTKRTRFVWRLRFNAVSRAECVLNIFSICAFIDTEPESTDSQTIGIQSGETGLPIYISPPFGIVARRKQHDSGSNVQNSVADKILNEIAKFWQ